MNSAKISLSENECSHHCQSTQHGAALVSAVSMHGSSSLATISYLRWLCSNYGKVLDLLGRSALHLAASCGCRDVACWLIRHGEASVNLKDSESGYTPLHRSIFYGQIHVATSLIHLGASISCLDHDDLTALDHAMKDRMPYVEYNLHHPCEVYMWGTNNNYTLGTGNQHGRPVPELLDSFRRQSISIKQVAMQKFHSVFVAHNGRVFSCGHGQGGRLGLGTEQATLIPSQMKLPSVSPGSETLIAAASVGRDHTVLLSENRIVLTCGLNTHHQLGHLPPPPFLLTARPVGQKLLKGIGTIQGVCASRFHTVIWGQKGLVTFGLHAGQLGHSKSSEMTQTVPRLVSAINPKVSFIITCVAASDGATVVTTSKGDIYTLYEYQCRKIASRQQDIVKVEVVGGHLDSRVAADVLMDRGGEQLKIAVLTSSGKLLLWQESTQQLVRCMFSINRSLAITDVALSRTNLLLLTTRDGEAFEGDLKTRKIRKPGPASPPSNSSGSFHEFLDKSDCEQIRLKRLPHTHRAVCAVCDPKGRNYAVIQTHPKAALLEIPVVQSSNMSEQMKALLQNTHAEGAQHDVVFLVGTREFPAHRFVIASRSEPLGKLIQDRRTEAGEIPHVKISFIRPEIFEQILDYIYTDDCSYLQHDGCIPFTADSNSKENIEHSCLCEDQFMSEENSNNKKNKNKTSQIKHESLKMMMEAAKRFGLSALQQSLAQLKFAYIVNGNTLAVSNIGRLRFSLKDHQDLCDVSVMSEDGQEIRAHKCILSARLDYVNSMLNHGWLEPSQTSKLRLPVVYKVLKVLLAFLYEDDSQLLRESDDLDLVCNALVVADEFFVTRMKEICEITLAGLLTLRNAAQLFQFADTYNAKQLKRCSMQFICLNLGAELETRALEVVSDSLLEELSQYYREFNPRMARRTITPYSDAPSQSLVETVAEVYPVTLGSDKDDMFEGYSKKSVKSVKKKLKIRKACVVESNKTNERTRNESISSNYSVTSDDGEGKTSLTFDDLTNRPGNDTVTLDLCTLNVTPPASSPWIKVTSNNSKQQKILQARLKTITSAMENPALVEVQENFTNVALNLRQSAPKSVPQASHSRPNVTSSPPGPASPPLELILDFPELSTSSQHHKSHLKPVIRASDVKIPVKISQKQRKKIAADAVEQPEKVNSPPKPAWGAIGVQGSSLFADIMREEAKGNRQESTSAPVPISPQQSCSSTNPWQKTQSSPVSSPETNVKFQDIVADEKKQRENWSKMRAKPLELTQLEDKAIEDLLIFYNAAEVSDERITVRRVVQGNVAAPTWITSHH